MVQSTKSAPGAGPKDNALVRNRTFLCASPLGFRASLQCQSVTEMLEPTSWGDL
ncbi:hypothetical protein H634G_11755 [Metarhizium anisopliae BRIP 53293]|uniref:Uncharacterized protein n=1 Tax=Metarhizium anisopliae BRIP 53293 TaxID=1291518 RepID=A0A0D9NGY6_METAN|nr:hypothetical protein H634G_11755 [Metarhizium anisopliae BRIP 53293]